MILSDGARKHLIDNTRHMFLKSSSLVNLVNPIYKSSQLRSIFSQTSWKRIRFDEFFWIPYDLPIISVVMHTLFNRHEYVDEYQ
jgi:hypothetical protein